MGAGARPNGRRRDQYHREGRNYGWPRVSYGVNYDGTPVGNGKATMDGVTDQSGAWTPSIAPSGMAFTPAISFRAGKAAFSTVR